MSQVSMMPAAEGVEDVGGEFYPFRMAVQLRYRFRVYPTGPQRAMLARTFGSVRIVFNDAVAARRAAHERGQPYPVSGVLQRRLITEAKRTPERAWLSEVSAVPLQQAVRDCDTAYANFFAALAGRRGGGRVGPPRFRKRSHVQTARFTRQGFRLRPGGRLYLPKIGEIKVAWSRKLPAAPSSVTVIKSATAKYFASFVVDVEQSESLRDVPLDTGVDLGLHSFAVLRGGKLIDNPRFFARLERKLKRAQRVYARKSKGSNNQEKARLLVARVHEQIANGRRDFIEQSSTRIIRKNHAVYVEGLNVKGLARGRAAKSVHDAAWGSFLRTLEAKASRAGRGFVRVDRYFPSTRLCSTCGALTGPKGLDGLKVRAWRCTGCGVVHDRDRNAEINIRREGRRLLAERRSTRDVCGETGEAKRLRSADKTGNARHGAQAPARGRNQEPTRSAGAPAPDQPGIV